MDFQRLKPHLPWITLVVLVAIVGSAKDTFLKPANLLNLAGDIVPLFIMALGLTFAICIGGIDLLAQSMANLITVVAKIYLAPLGAAVALPCVAVGAGLGTISGHVTTKLMVPSFISTLAAGGIAISLSQYLSGQKALNMDAAQRDAVFGWMIGKKGAIANELFIAAVLWAATLFIERRTTLGRFLKAVGAREPAALDMGRGQYIAPTLFWGVTSQMAIARDEIFGPVLCSMHFDTAEEAIAMANDTVYRLAALVWTTNIDKALTVTRRVRAGRFWVNCIMAGGPEMPLGGVKQSGWGREAGIYGVEEYTQVKSVHVEIGKRAHWIA